MTDEPATEPRNPTAAKLNTEAGLIAGISIANSENRIAGVSIVSGLLGLFVIVGRPPKPTVG